jgi:tRNA 2-thiouridine synthesizing protein B
MILHTVNKSPYERINLDSCLRVARIGCGILLLEDGVIAALATGAAAQALSVALSDKSVYVLGPDLDARGLRECDLVIGIKIVDYDGFVDLVAGYDTVQAWL